jgi:uncharacterized damage-inducible protein DinB
MQLKEEIRELVKGGNAHASFNEAVEGVPKDVINEAVEGVPYTLWELLEHIRIAQNDIVEFIVQDSYEPRSWPDDYWPDEKGTGAKWEESVALVRSDRDRLLELLDSVRLTDTLPHAEEYTYLREFLLVADHVAYHVGQIIVIRRQLGVWN